MTHDIDIGRRSVLKGAGIGLAGLGGLASPVAAGGATPLTDKAADILVYWSQVKQEETDPDDPNEFGFPGPSNPKPPGGLTFAAHDPAGGGLFDFSRIALLPDGNLVNGAFTILGGVLAKPPYPSYQLVPVPGTPGLFTSVGQEMDFKARGPGQIKKLLGHKGSLPPAFNKLGGTKWHVVGSEFSKLGVDANGDPNPADPQWGATRVDFYHQASMEYGLSLLYVIGASDTPNPADGVPPAAYRAGGGLIVGGRLAPSSP